MALTWKTLRDHINVMDNEQLNSDVTVQATEMDEFFQVTGYDITEVDDVLDKNHPFLTIQA